MKRQLAACFVLIENSAEKVAGFFTLSAASIPLTDLPEAERNKIGKYAAVPAARIGRLATHSAYQGQGLGTAMLARAMQYAATSPVACFAVLVDAKDEAAARFYGRHGYLRFSSRPLTLFLPVKTVQAATPKARSCSCSRRSARIAASRRPTSRANALTPAAERGSVRTRPRLP